MTRRTDTTILSYDYEPAADPDVWSPPGSYRGRHRAPSSIVWPVLAVVATFILTAIFVSVSLSHSAGARKASDDTAPADTGVADTDYGCDWVAYTDPAGPGYGWASRDTWPDVAAAGCGYPWPVPLAPAPLAYDWPAVAYVIWRLDADAAADAD